MEEDVWQKMQEFGSPDGRDRRRNYLGTYWSPIEGDSEQVHDDLRKTWTKIREQLTLHPDYYRYAVAQIEVGQTMRPHLQMYLQLKKSLRLTTIKKHLILEAIHLVHQKHGTHNDMRNYAMKSEGRLEGPWHWPTESHYQEPRPRDISLYETAVRLTSWRDPVDQTRIPVTAIATSHPRLWLRFSHSLDKWDQYAKEFESSHPMYRSRWTDVINDIIKEDSTLWAKQLQGEEE